MTPTAPPLEPCSISGNVAGAGLPVVTSVDATAAVTIDESSPDSVQCTIADRAAKNDPNLVRDLLRKANGDSTKVAEWLNELGLQNGTPKNGKLSQADSRERFAGDVDVAARQLGAPATFFCPISLQLFRDPVLISTGQTYERRAITRWLAEGTMKCPATGLMLIAPVALTPNVALRQAIEDWAAKNAVWLLDANGRILAFPDEGKYVKGEKNAAQNNTHVTVPSIDQDMALALRLQEQELSTMHRRTATLPPPRVDQPRRSWSGAYSEAKRMRRCMHLILVFTLVHICFFLYGLATSGWEFEKIDMNPLIGLSARVLDKIGATDTTQITDKNEWWRILSSVFISAGIVQLEGSIGALWTFGRFLAGRLSFLSLGLLYLTSGITGVLISANFATNLVTAGSSAGAFGLMGAVLVDLLLHWRDYRMHFVSIFVLFSVGAMNTIIGLTPLVDNWANIGGMGCGILLGSAFMLAGRQFNRSCCKEFTVVFLQILCSILAVALVIIGVVGLMVSWEGGQNCSACRKITCFNTRWWNCETARVLPEDCAFSIKGNLTTNIECPTGAIHTIPLPEPTQSNLEKFCRELCDIRKDSPLTPPPLSPISSPFSPETEVSQDDPGLGSFSPNTNTNLE